ncbi:ATP-binding cassette domain-containing protein [Leucobacter allii]|uniref:ATP-binding cassette domain-containing protein n=1 Tax=Leucobacter allii TaxID=2932247 RepID=UPI003D2A3E27
MMVGRSIAMHRRERHVRETAGEQPVLELRNFTSAKGFSDVTVSVAPGEIVGIAGVVGSGKGTLGRAIFELGRGCSGEILIDGERPKRTGPRAGIQRSVGYVPTERHREGLVLGMSVAQNHSLPFIGAAIGGPVIDGAKERREAVAAIEQLSIKTPGPGTLIRNLSGGNQQKVILARWLTIGSKLLVLDNPTNGVDVGAKGEIYTLLEEITASGVSVILISDDLPELLTMSDRILVMKDGRVRTEHAVDPAAPPAEVDLVAEMV